MRCTGTASRVPFACAGFVQRVIRKVAPLAGPSFDFSVLLNIMLAAKNPDVLRIA